MCVASLPACRLLAVSNHLSPEEKRRPENWWLLCLVEIVDYPADMSPAVARRARAAMHYAVLRRVMRGLRGLAGRRGVTCVDINGDELILVPYLQDAQACGARAIGAA